MAENAGEDRTSVVDEAEMLRHEYLYLLRFVPRLMQTNLEIKRNLVRWIRRLQEENKRLQDQLDTLRRASAVTCNVTYQQAVEMGLFKVEAEVQRPHPADDPRPM